MSVEVVTETLDMDRVLPRGKDPQWSDSLHASRPTKYAEDRLAEAVVQLIQRNGKVQEAIMGLVLSSPYIQWEL